MSDFLEPNISVPSAAVYSNQKGQIHTNLAKIISKHLEKPFCRPIADYNQMAFEFLQQQGVDKPEQIILDSCCGTGYSSYQLAERYPEHWIIGIDRSEYRLQKKISLNNPSNKPSQNVTLIRADCVDLWRLMLQAGWQPEKHYLLYPNPYPKASQFKLRWHGHPVFADLVRLGAYLEARSNWPVYIEEFAQALSIAGYVPQYGLYQASKPYASLFERKYVLSGHDLYRCTVTL